MRLVFQALLSLLYLGSYHHAAKKIWTKVTHTCYSKRNFTLPLTYQRSAKLISKFQTMTSNRSAPQFLRPLSGTMELTEGDELVLDVTVHGKPTPEVEWILNGSEIKMPIRTRTRAIINSRFQEYQRSIQVATASSYELYIFFHRRISLLGAKLFRARKLCFLARCRA